MKIIQFTINSLTHCHLWNIIYNISATPHLEYDLNNKFNKETKI